MRYVRILMTRHTIFRNRIYYFPLKDFYERTGKLYDGIKSQELLFPVDKYKKWHEFPASDLYENL